MARLSLLGHKIPIDNGGVTVSGPIGWYGVEFGGYRYRTIEVLGTTFSGTYYIEVTLDPNSILIDNNGNLKSGAVGHADASTIPAYGVASGAGTNPAVFDLTSTPNTFIGSANIVAVRVNVITATNGTLNANLSVVP